MLFNNKNNVPRYWYALHTRSRCENMLSQALKKKAFEIFLPKVTVQSTRKDRRVMINRPLFPGYTFVKTDFSRHEHYEIVKTAGFVRFVGNRIQPLPIADETIASLKIMISTNSAITTGRRFQKGDRIIVVYGPLTGVTGIFTKQRGKERVAIQIEALGQYASVEINAADIEKLPKIVA